LNKDYRPDASTRRLQLEYEAVIKVMKEQISALKQQLGASDNALRRFKCNEHAEMLKELKELRTAVNIAREDSKVKDLRVKQLETEVEDLTNALRSYEDYQERLEAEADRWRRMASIDEERRGHHFESITDHSPVLTRRPCEDSSIDKLHAANKRFQSLMKKLEQSEQSRLQLEERNKRLEADRKKLMQKWQNSVQRYKQEDKIKARLKSLESAVAYKDKDKSQLEEQLRESMHKLSELQASKSHDAGMIAKTEEAVKRLMMQKQLDEDEKSLLKRLNQELAYKAQLQQIELNHYKQDANQLRVMMEKFQAQAKQQEESSTRDQELLDAQRSQSLSGILKSLVSETERPLLSIIPEKRAATPQRAHSVLHGGNSYYSTPREEQQRPVRSSRTPPPRKLQYSPYPE